ncbi:MAG: MBL fold metallo-hydrolase [Acidobacteriota bacterium]
MEQVAPGTALIDVEYLGERHYIACALLQGDSGATIIDPGPAVSLPGLERGLDEAGLSLAELDAVLLTHIHLDHAGATGTIVRRNPQVRVFVHERGARHMIDPSRLLRSAGRLYGDRMDSLWGEFLAVPEGNVEALSGGERLRLAGRDLEVAYTPGHASHHVSYMDSGTGIAFVGDTAGIRIANEPFVLPVTPPPDIDLESWSGSLERIEAWRLERLFVTHFGPGENVPEHLERFRDGLHQWSDSVRASLEGGGDDADRAATFDRQVGEDLDRQLPVGTVRLYRQGAPIEMSWYGLARYWRKRWEEEK